MRGHASSIPDQDQFLSLREAADRGYAGYSTLRKYIADGKLPARRVGNRVRLRKSDLDALMVDHGASAVDSAIDRLLACAPPLTDDQVRRLTSLLGGAK